MTTNMFSWTLRKRSKSMGKLNMILKQLKCILNQALRHPCQKSTKTSLSLLPWMKDPYIPSKDNTNKKPDNPTIIIPIPTLKIRRKKVYFRRLRIRECKASSQEIPRNEKKNQESSFHETHTSRIKVWKNRKQKQFQLRYIPKDSLDTI